MVTVSQHSAGAGYHKRRRMLFIFLWFIACDSTKVTFCSSIASRSQHDAKTNSYPHTRSSNVSSSFGEKSADFSSYKNPQYDQSVLQRTSRAVPRPKITEQSLENISKNYISSDFVLKIPLSILRQREFYRLLRPLRGKENQVKSNKKRNTIIPTLRFGRSGDENVLDTLIDNGEFISKRYDTIIPTVRFGRANNEGGENGSNSIIPYPRLGRSSDSKSENKINFIEEINNEHDSNDIENYMLNEGMNDDNQYDDMFQDGSDSESVNKRDVEDYNTIIPYPRPGREALENEFLERKLKKVDPDYILPQIRYGRSMLLLSPPKTEDASKQKPTHTFVLPYPRPGRSNKDGKFGKSENERFILPYPRPGRSGESIAENPKLMQSSKVYMLPTSRLGRNAFNSYFESENDNIEIEDGFLGLKFNPLFLKSQQKNLSEKPSDKTESNSVFVIPYPRPGKKSSIKIKNENQSPKNTEIGVTEYVLPYPRPGKKSEMQQLSKESENEVAQLRGFIVPYPRPGRSIKNSFDDVADPRDMFYNKENVDEIMEWGENEYKSLMDLNDSYLTLNKIHDSKSLLNSGQIDKRSRSLVPYPRPGRSMDAYSHAQIFSEDPYFNFNGFDYESFMLGLDSKTDEDFAQLRLKRSTTVVPYPRLGRSYSNLRLKKSNTIVPYPRFGRSTFVAPLPRLERSNSIVPYPRFGRSIPNDLYSSASQDNFAVSDTRTDRSESVVPYPRPGRSGSVVPYPRLGRSEALVPYPRPGRSEAVVPYPRAGRSESVVPYPRPGRSESVVPYPRPGRSGSVVPYPRPGRSGDIVPYPRPGRSGSVVPYPRPGRSGSVIPYPRLGRSGSVVPYPRLGRSVSVIPYPRPGRSRSVVPYSRPGRSGSVVPYPRPGRSGSVVPYPRPGRSESVVPYPRPGRSGSVVPYPRPGRSGSLVPYPRPGRSGSVVPYPRPGRSGSVVPYPRLGKSDSIVPYSRLGHPYQEKTDFDEYTKTENGLLSNFRAGHSNLKRDDSYIVPYPRPGRSNDHNSMHHSAEFEHWSTKKNYKKDISFSKKNRSKPGQGYVLPLPRIGRSEESENSDRETTDADTVIPYPRLGRSQKQVTPSSEAVNSIHKLNKHMLTSVDDSIYLLPYPRPGRYSEESF